MTETIEAFLGRGRKATINDVARLAGVSKKTVSRVINNSPSVHARTRDDIAEIITRVGFRPDPQARGLAFRRALLIGLIYDNPNAQYIVNMQMGALDRLRGSGIELVVHPCTWHSETFLSELRDFLESQRPSGVIVLPPIAEDRQLLDLLEELNVPRVRVTARTSGDGNAAIGREIVSCDDIGCAEAGAHVAGLGHRRIGYIGGNPDYPSAHVRRHGFETGLAAHGAAIAPDLDEPGNYSFESGYAAARRLLRRPDRPTAIICANDEMAAGAYKAAFEADLRIPGDLTLIGFDDAPIADRLSPPLTTVRLPTRDMARMAADLLVSRPATADQTMTVPSALIVRGSSGAPKAGL
ncbi:LacI family DNA-binding transcriptional regulator [Asticcacaulis taihuensis]|uniref:Transcriptional regulator, LacI family n=1 Tax=Asticcacaulis taihuensis TaxID=260084 RepID=A0A1G4RSA2_9CAUL|nr:LacI family DNA-binding transcriptional regulator [Asticcacaulis taihuensis]SCW59813.1 transcriptional regulator, LacI family [Asticcacaulis taihuensis]